MTRAPYPLAWPPGTRRTAPADRRRSHFGERGAGQLSPYEAAKDLLAELRRLGASNVVITSLLPTRHDGLPYSDGRSEDPGIAVWCTYNGRERVFACDEWRTHGENLRAIAKSIEALRGLSRWGMADVAERAFAGFAALPSGDPEPPRSRPWRELLGMPAAQLEPDDELAIARARYRKLIAEAHPDRGGDTARAAALNAALDAATKELS